MASAFHSFNRPYRTKRLQHSGLARLIQLICRPGDHLEAYRPHLVESCLLYRWKDTLAELLDRWTPTAMVPEPKNIPELPLDFNPHALPLLRLMDQNLHLQPGLSDPAGVFFLVSLETFRRAWSAWLKPALDKHTTFVSFDYRFSVPY